MMTIVQTQGVRALGICDVFNILDDLLHRGKQEISKMISIALDDNAEQLVWCDGADVHYIWFGWQI